jgi:hypothetical protein
MYANLPECLLKNALDGLILGCGGSAVLRILLGKRLSVVKVIGPAVSIAILMMGVNGVRRATSQQGRGKKGQMLLASLVMYVVQSTLGESLRHTLLLYLLARSVVQHVPERGLLAVSLMSNFIVLGAFLDKPHLLAPSYLRFLYRFTNQDAAVMQRFRSEIECNPMACAHLHPFQPDCRLAAPPMFYNIFSQHAVPFYAKLYAPMTLVTLLRARNTNKVAVLGGYLARTMRSSVMLGTYTALVLSAACCIGLKLPVKSHRKLVLPAVGAITGAVSFYIESESRRSQVVQFMLTHAFEVITRAMSQLGTREVPRLLQGMIFSVVAAHHLESLLSDANGIDMRIVSLLFDTEQCGTHKLSPIRLLSSR